VRVVLASKQFAFTSARVLLFRLDHEFVLNGQCTENVIAELNVEASGAYDLWLSDIEVRSLSSGATFRLNGLLRPWVVEFTRQDLDRGTATVVAPLGGVFQITVMNAARLPVPYYKLLASTDDATKFDMTTLEIPMNANGTFVTYDNPTRCRLIIDPGCGILIEHLDIPALDGGSESW
jgi:hypothetical protein